MKNGVKDLKVAALIREMVEKSGQTQSTLAKKLGIAQSVLSRQLQGKESIPFSRITKIAELLADSKEAASELANFFISPLKKNGISVELEDFIDRTNFAAIGKSPDEDKDAFQKFKRDMREWEANAKREQCKYEDLYAILARFVLWALGNRTEAMNFLSKIDDKYFLSTEIPDWAGKDATLEDYIFNAPLLPHKRSMELYDELKELRRSAKKL